MMQGAQTLPSVTTYLEVGCGGWGRGKEVQEGEDMCVSMAEFILKYGRKQNSIVKGLSSN